MQTNKTSNWLAIVFASKTELQNLLPEYKLPENLQKFALANLSLTASSNSGN